MTNDIDISPEAVESLKSRVAEFWAYDTGHLFGAADDMIDALSAALTQSRAEMAKLLAMNDAGYDTVTYRAVAAAEARGMRKAAAIVDADVQKAQPEMTHRAQRLAAAKAPGFQYAIHRADLDARISCRDKILAAISQGEMK